MGSAPPHACLPPTGSGLTFGYGILCAPTTTPSSAHGYLQPADATQTYLFMDGVHLTERGQQIEADYFYNLLVAPSEISFLAETAIQTTFQTVIGIQQQIDLAQQRVRASTTNGRTAGYWLDDEQDSDDSQYEALTCPACSKVHFINRKTGKLFGVKKNNLGRSGTQVYGT